MHLRQGILVAACALTVLVVALRPDAGAGVDARVNAAPVHDAPGCPRSGEVPKPADIEVTRAVILCLLNGERAKLGLPALKRSILLELASQRHSEDMANRLFFAHDTPEGVTPRGRMRAAGYPLALTGENLYAGTNREATPVEALAGWMKSPGHRENILRPQFIEVGVGVAYRFPKPDVTDPAAVYTTDFGGP